MSNISKQDIENLATLARMRLGEDEKEGLQKDVSNILGYVESIQSVDTSDVSDTPLVHTVLRDDTEAHESGAYTDALIESAPQSENGYVKVQKILGGNDE